MCSLDIAWQFVGDNWAAIIAVCALGVSFYQASATRRHNRLSVRPHLVVSADKSNDNGRAMFVARLKNNGLGPAVVRKYEIFLDGSLFPIGDSGVVASTVASVLGRPTPHVAYHRIGVGDSIAKDQELILLSVGFSCTSQQDYQLAMKAFERITSHIQYESMYGQSFSCDSRASKP